MALTNKQRNFINDVQTLSLAILTMSNTVNELLARWSLENLSAMTDVDIAAVMPEMTIERVTAAMGSLVAVQAAFGDMVSGQLVNFEKMRG